MWVKSYISHGTYNLWENHCNIYVSNIFFSFYFLYKLKLVILLSFGNICTNTRAISIIYKFKYIILV